MNSITSWPSLLHITVYFFVALLAEQFLALRDGTDARCLKLRDFTISIIELHHGRVSVSRISSDYSLYES